MKKCCYLLILTLASLSAPLNAQRTPSPDPLSARADHLATNAPGGYAVDLGVVRDAQQQALEQARQMLTQSHDAKAHSVLESAIQAMGRRRRHWNRPKNRQTNYPLPSPPSRPPTRPCSKPRPMNFACPSREIADQARVALQANLTSSSPTSWI